jgi:hypothetical protein
MFDECMLTTSDNPFNYFTDFSSWYLFDMEKGYNSCGYLARIANLSDDMTQIERNQEIERAIDEIIAINPLPIWQKVWRSGKKSNT